MQFKLRPYSARLLATAAVISGATLLVAVGCGGGSSDDSGSPSGGSGGSAGSGDTGGTSTGGTTGKAGAGGKGGSTGKAGSSSGGSGAEAGALGEGGEAGAVNLPPAQNTSSVQFVTSAAKSSSKNFVLISNTGESLGGTVGSKQSKSLKYTYIPGVIAATSP